MRSPLVILICLAIAGTSISSFSQTISPKRSNGHVKNISFKDISPDSTGLHNPIEGASSGRINRVAAAPGNIALYAASEWGGLFESRDKGQTWVHIDGHSPSATWDVKTDPFDANIVYATSFYDGRVKSRAGINVSRDGGVTWQHPKSAVPNQGFCSERIRAKEPSAFGIAIDKENPNDVYIGTNCGLAISHNRGKTWRYRNPAAKNTRNDAGDVWSVIVHHKGIIDVCGPTGHYRSKNDGKDWTPKNERLNLPEICSITASPDEADVLFVSSGGFVYESADGGECWNTIVNQHKPSRPAFVRTNKRDGPAFDLWYGEVFLHRINCATPLDHSSRESRCSPIDSENPNHINLGEHDDAGDILFGDDGCPTVYSSDGGVYLAKRDPKSQCQDPKWQTPEKTPHALSLLSMACAVQTATGQPDTFALYFGSRDNGAFETNNPGDDSPQWNCLLGKDVMDFNADTNQIVFSNCCSEPMPGQSDRSIVLRDRSHPNRQLVEYPGRLLGGRAIDSIQHLAKNSYTILTTEGIFTTANISANPVNWQPLSEKKIPADGCGLRVSVSNGQSTIYLETGKCTGQSADRLFKFSDGNWIRIQPPFRNGGFGIFSVFPTNPNMLIASHLTNKRSRIIISNDGGLNWRTLRGLDHLMSGKGRFKGLNKHGPTEDGSFLGYPQPTLLAYDSSDPRTIVAGAADSGIFLTSNGGHSWKVITDNSGGTLNPRISRPQFAMFDHRNGFMNLYVGTQGRGVWRIRIREER